MKNKKYKRNTDFKKEMPDDISELIYPDEIIVSVESMLGHSLKDRDKETVNAFLKSHTLVEDYLRILKNK